MLLVNANINKSYYFPGHCFPTLTSKGLFYYLFFVAERGDGVAVMLVMFWQDVGEGGESEHTSIVIVINHLLSVL